MKKILVFIIASMSFNSIAQTKIYNQPVKYRITPNLSVVDSILTKSSVDLLSATSVNDFKTQIGIDNYVLKTGDVMTGNLTIDKAPYDPSLSVFSDAHLSLKISSNPVTNGGSSISMPISVSNNYGVSISSARRSGLVSRGTFSVRTHNNSSVGVEILNVNELGEVTANKFIGDGSSISNVDAATLNGQTSFDTDLSYTASPTQGTVTSSTGTDAIIPAVTGTNAGLQKPDFYDEGNGSVTLSGGTYTLGSATYYYVRSGNDVTLSVDIQNINGTGSGQLAIGSLPYNPSTSGFHVSSINLFSGSTYGTPVDLRANLNSGSNTIRFNTITSAAYVSSIDFTSGRIRLDITYRVNVYTP